MALLQHKRTKDVLLSSFLFFVIQEMLYNNRLIFYLLVVVVEVTVVVVLVLDGGLFVKGMMLIDTDTNNGCHYEIDGELVWMKGKDHYVNVNANDNSSSPLLISTNATFSNCIFSPIAGNNHSVDFNSSVLIVYHSSPRQPSHPSLSVGFFNCTFQHFRYHHAVTLTQRLADMESDIDNYDDMESDDNKNNDDNNREVEKRWIANNDNATFGSFDVLFVDCEFDSNLVSLSVVSFQMEGFSMNVSVVGSTFRHNSQNAVNLQKVSIRASSSPSSSDPQVALRFLNNSFIDNFSSGGSGAAMNIENIDASEVLIDSCLFENNVASLRGGALYISSQDSTLCGRFDLSPQQSSVVCRRWGHTHSTQLVIVDSIFDLNSVPCDEDGPVSMRDYCVAVGSNRQYFVDQLSILQ